MSGKSKLYWSNAWNNAKSDSDYNDDAGKVLNLLSQYAGFYKRMPVVGFGFAWGGAIGRFFSGRWNTHHGSQVQNAIDIFYDMGGWYAHTQTFHSVEFILASVKQKIGNTPINPNGDLARILAVVRDKTNVDYFQLDADKIVNQYICTEKAKTPATIADFRR